MRELEHQGGQTIIFFISLLFCSLLGFATLNFCISKWNENHQSFQKEGNRVPSTVLVIGTRREKPFIPYTCFVPISCNDLRIHTSLQQQKRKEERRAFRILQKLVFLRSPVNLYSFWMITKAIKMGQVIEIKPTCNYKGCRT